jgi:hypothetical protein
VVFGAGTAVIALPATTSPTKLEPVSLTDNPLPTWEVVLTALTSAPVIKPPSRLT